ncbi:MAG: hypothetical protein U9R25_14195 [Chloroflexota bacterium]|nr:hypothetical protein [Chloroflexota bacterium]
MTATQIANQFSFLIFPLTLFAIAAIVLLARHAGWTWWAGWAILLVGFLAIVLSTGQRNTARFDSDENIRRSLASGEQPTLVEFFSNY